jgi:hypothetical protein
VVPAGRHPPGPRPDRTPTGAGDGLGLLPSDGRDHDPDPARAGSIAGHWALLQQIGAVPRELVWDNEGAVGSWRSGRPKLAEEFESFRGVLGIAVHQCKPNDPEAKGLVERGNGY